MILSLAPSHPSHTEQGEAAARVTARLLRGEYPVEVSIDLPMLMRLVLNLKEAESMGIMVPPDLFPMRRG